MPNVDGSSFLHTCNSVCAGVVGFGRSSLSVSESTVEKAGRFLGKGKKSTTVWKEETGTREDG
jgi:hypothetical protein